MKYSFRTIYDKSFSVLTAGSVVLMILVLIIILGPMVVKGLTAVFFTSTVEFSRMQYDMFDRGDKSKIAEQLDKANKYKAFVYERIDEFKKGIDVDIFNEKVKDIYRQFSKELQYNNITGTELSDRRAFARQIRKDLEKAFAGTDKKEIIQILDEVGQYKDDPRLGETSAGEFFELAKEYKRLIENFDLSKRQQYAQALEQVEDIVAKLFGPGPKEPLPVLVMDRYGATRYDLAQKLLDQLQFKDVWVQKIPNQPLVKEKVSRAQDFAGTRLEAIFPYIKDNFDKMVLPEFTIYWQYFLDDSIAGHYFGGIGPEILGTLILTVLAMAVVFPLGVISAAYLVECASDNLAVRIIRMCINTLAGVPSIVFGLFGLAFFVLFLFPVLHFPSKPCILAASLTLAVLALPVMIRASEEAIRSVPQTYKEASLGLGASGFRTFIKVTLPAAMPGILTGVILSLSRVAGETAPILFTGTVKFGSIPRSIFSPTRTLSYGSYDIAVGDTIGMLVPHKQYGMVFTLVLLIMCLNGIAIVLRAKMFRKLRGH